MLSVNALVAEASPRETEGKQSIIPLGALVPVKILVNGEVCQQKLPWPD